MDEILGNRFLLASLVTVELTKDISKTLPYNYDTAFNDIHNSIREYYNSMTLDKRAVAVGTDGYLMTHELFDNPAIGWKQVLYMGCDYFALLLANISKPQRALIHGPDVHFNLVATLHSMGCELTFVNNKYLNNFEKFALNNSEYPFEMQYDVMEYFDIYELNQPTFDMVVFPGISLIRDMDLFNPLIDSLTPGGILQIPYTNDNSQLYGEDYAIQPSYQLLEIIDYRSDITSYHIPYGNGHNTIIKNA
jgi:hypothetical protein